MRLRGLVSSSSVPTSESVLASICHVVLRSACAGVWFCVRQCVGAASQVQIMYVFNPTIGLGAFSPPQVPFPLG